MMRAAVLCLLLACSHSQRLDQTAVARVKEHDTKHQVIEQGPTSTVEVDEYEEEPAPVEKPKAAGPAEPPAARPTPRLLRRTITTEQLPIGPAGPAVRVRDSEHRDVQATATVQTHSESKTSPSLGFQIWLWFIPLGLAALAAIAWKVRSWIL